MLEVEEANSASHQLILGKEKNLRPCDGIWGPFGAFLSHVRKSFFPDLVFPGAVQFLEYRENYGISLYSVPLQSEKLMCFVYHVMELL